MSNYIKASTQNVTNTRTKVSKIIQFLKAHRGPHSVHNIRARTRIDLQRAENLAVKTALHNNEKVTVMGTTFQYRPFIPGINNKTELMQYIQQRPQGVRLKELEDAYVAARTHLTTWYNQGRTIQFMNSDTKEHYVFWYFGRLRKHPIQTEKEKEKERAIRRKNGEKVDSEDEEEKTKNISMDLPEEIKDGGADPNIFPLIGDSIIATWGDIKIPATFEDLQRQLEDAKIIDGKFTKKRKRTKQAMNNGRQKKKRRMSMSRMNLTNTHMLQDDDLKKKMMAQNDKLNGGNERELPTLPQQKKE